MTWLDEVEATLESLGGVASLADIYARLEATTSRALTANWRATVRQTLEDHSSDGAFRRGRDVFFSAEGIGSGIWGLRAGVGLPPLDPGQIPDDDYVEGLSVRVTVNRYERSPAARRACIAAHGYCCAVCGFDFGAVYGPEATGYIHVHHIVPLSTISESYRVNPRTDLRPVCPNCHAMLHATSPPTSIEALRAKVTTRQDSTG